MARQAKIIRQAEFARCFLRDEQTLARLDFFNVTKKKPSPHGNGGLMGNGILGICAANACHADVVFFENNLVGRPG